MYVPFKNWIAIYYFSYLEITALIVYICRSGIKYGKFQLQKLDWLHDLFGMIANKVYTSSTFWALKINHRFIVTVWMTKNYIQLVYREWKLSVSSIQWIVPIATICLPSEMVAMSVLSHGMEYPIKRNRSDHKNFSVLIQIFQQQEPILLRPIRMGAFILEHIQRSSVKVLQIYQYTDIRLESVLNVYLVVFMVHLALAWIQLQKNSIIWSIAHWFSVSLIGIQRQVTYVRFEVCYYYSIDTFSTVELQTVYFYLFNDQSSTANRQVAFDFKSIGKTINNFIPVGMAIDTNGMIYTTDFQHSVYIINPRCGFKWNIILFTIKGLRFKFLVLIH